MTHSKLRFARARFAFFLLAAAVTAFVAGMTILPAQTEARRGEGAWCSRIRGSAVRCDYATHQQCRAAISGRRGECFQRRW